MYRKHRVSTRSIMWAAVVMGIIITLLSVSLADAKEGITISMPGGQTIPLDGLTDEEAKRVTELMKKVAEKKAEQSAVAAEASKVMSDVISDPTKLNAWRQVITGTIKDICNDLNVSVNEFIKTPAGAGVAALIIYKVAGKDLLSAIADVVLIIPFWFIMMSVLFYLQRKYLSCITVYERKRTIPQEEGKKPIVEETDPVRKTNYGWTSKDARTTFACVLYGTMLVVTLITLVIVF